jgi:hypothetical protein
MSVPQQGDYQFEIYPIGVIGLCSQDFHGDIAVGKASAQTGVPMAASTFLVFALTPSAW